MYKKVLSFILVIFLISSLSISAMALELDYGVIDLPEGDDTVVTSPDYNEYYTGFYDDYFDDYGFVGHDVDGIISSDSTVIPIDLYNLQNAYIKLSETQYLHGKDTIAFEDFVDSYHQSDCEDVENYLLNLLPDDPINSSVQSSSSSHDWYYNTGESLPYQATYDVYNLLSVVRKGDLIHEDSGTVMAKITNHIAIVEGIFWDSEQQHFYVRLIEAVDSGVCRGVLDDTRFDEKSVQVLRVPSATAVQTSSVVNFCISQLGKSYWIGTQPHSSKNSSSWYCSELAWAAYKNAGIDLVPNHGALITPKNIVASQKTIAIKVSDTMPSSLFRDISSISWATDAITFLVDNGILQGCTNTKFSPNTATNRAMVVTILYRLAGCPPTSLSSKFSDVQNKNAYYYLAVNWATNEGIVSGYPDGTFKPNVAVTREQLATFLYRFANTMDLDTYYYNSALSSFTDRGSISSYALTPMKRAVTHGLICGTSATTISPKSGGTRAQTAVMVYRFLCNLM